MGIGLFRNSYATAAVIAFVLIAYFVLRSIGGGGATETVGDLDPAAFEDPDFLVEVVTLNAEPHKGSIVLRGRTQALRAVTVRSETIGVIAATPVEPGVSVKKGEILCEIAVDARRAQYNQAKASLAQADLEYKAAKELFDKGHRSETALLGATAQRDLAKAGLEQAELELAKTKIRAPFDGVFDDRQAEIGDFLNLGAPCGVVIQQTPFLVVGDVSERDVSLIQKGAAGRARLPNGDTFEGGIRLVSRRADPTTRTFRVELETPNENFLLRDGMTAELIIDINEVMAHMAPQSAMTLNDDGVLGVRAVNTDNIVEFHPVDIIADVEEGFWISGLHGDITIITRGQDFVSEGQRVRTQNRGA
ncbi:MAG: efflux RND transporter periplasmic adaptor subunit [Pseudomonadota bacterium]